MTSQFAYRVDLHSRISGGVEEIHSFATVAYSTSPAADPPSTFYDGRVTQPAMFMRSMFGAADTLFGGLTIGYGFCRLLNSDGGLDYLFNYAFDGSPYRLWRVDLTDPDNPELIFEGMLEQPTWDEESIVFSIRDQNYKLDIPLHTQHYAGTNALPAGVEGTPDDIQGAPKPILVGGVYNFEPVCVNTSKLIYQFDSWYTDATDVIIVFDKRVQLTQGTDYTSQADMEANAPSAGTVRLWMGGGMFRLGSQPVGQVTCTGTVMPPGGASYLEQVVQALLAFGYSGNFEAQMATTITTGIYSREETTVLGAINEVLEGTDAFLVYGPSPTGAYAGNGYFLSQLTDPTSLPYTPLADTLDLNPSNIVAGTLQRILQRDLTSGIPVSKVNLQCGRNYTVMSPTDIAGASAADVVYYGLEYRTKTASDGTVKTDWPQAPEINLRSNMHDAWGDSVAAMYLSLVKYRRDMYSLEIPVSVYHDVPAISGADRYTLLIGSRVSITFPRFGLDSGKLFLVISILENYDKETVTLTVWG